MKLIFILFTLSLFHSLLSPIIISIILRKNGDISYSIFVIILRWFSPISGVENEIPYSPPPDFCRQRSDKAVKIGRRAAVTLPTSLKRFYNRLQPLQASLVLITKVFLITINDMV